MSHRVLTLILPTHNSATAQVFAAILGSEGETDEYAPHKQSDAVTLAAGYMVATAENWRPLIAREGFVIQTHNLHISIRPLLVQYDRSKRRHVTRSVSVTLSAYSCDPYGREAIAKIVEQVATRY